MFRLDIEPPDDAEELIVYDVTDEGNWNPGQFLINKLRIGGDSPIIPIVPSATWDTLTTEDVLNQFTIAEASAIRTLQGSGSGSGLPFENIDAKVIRVIDEVRGYVAAGGYTVDDDPRTIPLSLFEDAIAIVRWRLLVSLPAFLQLQSEPRKLAYEHALAKLLMIAQQKFAIVPPGSGESVATAGLWNSENKILMRTHPVPRPGAQFTPQINTYANPDAPTDTEIDT